MGVRINAAGARTSGSETTYSDVRDRSADSNSAYESDQLWYFEAKPSFSSLA